MIRQVRASQRSFRNVEFESGLNVVLAHRMESSTQRGSRNGLGKTTLLSIIRFCLGEIRTSKKNLCAEELQGWEFSVDLDIGSDRVTASRSVDKPNQVTLNADGNWLHRHVTDKSSQSRLQQSMTFHEVRGNEDLHVDAWRTILGAEMYGLKGECSNPHPVSVESLISYDIRCDQFDDPFVYRPRQYKSDILLSNAYLLDLSWTFASQWQEVSSRVDAIKSEQATRKIDGHLLADMPESVGELETERDQLQRLVDKTDADLRSFQVHPQYVQIENEANDLTRQIHDLSNHVLQLKRLIDFHDESAKDEQPASDEKVIELYKEAGVALSAPLVKRLEDVQAFHFQITKNRRDYLSSEVSRLNQELEHTIAEREQLSIRKAELMRILDNQGAIEEYRRIEHLYGKQRSILDATKRQIEHLNWVETETSKVNIEREKLLLDARRDFEEKSSIKQARNVFNSNSEHLYEAPGKLVVNIDRNLGYRFEIVKERSDSAGISKMKTLCYDLMRAELWSQRDVRPGFLIHDSDIFAGVDERQIARALELGERKSREFGFQYIVCLNSDKIPESGFSEGFSIDDYVRLILKDDTPEGSLLGIRF